MKKAFSYIPINLRPGVIPVVRTIRHFGVMEKNPESVRLFLDDEHNPPLTEEGWVVVRTVADGIAFLEEHGDLVTELSLDNDLGPDPQGIELLRWLLRAANYRHFPQLTTVTIHTGNLPRWREMIRLLRKSNLIVHRRVPSDRTYPRASTDDRIVKPFTG